MIGTNGDCVLSYKGTLLNKTVAFLGYEKRTPTGNHEEAFSNGDFKVKVNNNTWTALGWAALLGSAGQPPEPIMALLAGCRMEITVTKDMYAPTADNLDFFNDKGKTRYTTRTTVSSGNQIVCNDGVSTMASATPHGGTRCTLGNDRHKLAGLLSPTGHRVINRVCYAKDYQFCFSSENSTIANHNGGTDTYYTAYNFRGACHGDNGSPLMPRDGGGCLAEIPLKTGDSATASTSVKPVVTGCNNVGVFSSSLPFCPDNVYTKIRAGDNNAACNELVYKEQAGTACIVNRSLSYDESTYVVYEKFPQAYTLQYCEQDNGDRKCATDTVGNPCRYGSSHDKTEYLCLRRFFWRDSGGSASAQILSCTPVQ
jgi:hypothetical protein